ncbi:MAG: SMP-30/Gluconolaconase/LRE domain protein [Herminiimonas sp.]|nr:SMP-30/Gluconolaconase/LRE domain protein [Herminiimonas sp.]
MPGIATEPVMATVNIGLAPRIAALLCAGTRKPAARRRPDARSRRRSSICPARGRLDPRSGKTQKFPLGDGSAPHGVIVGPDGATWIADGGLNAIVHVNPKTGAVTCFPLPKDRKNANLNTAVFDKKGHLWSTGQGGFEPVFRTGVERLRTVLALIVELTTESASGG